MPLLSIIIPTFNRAPLLSLTIENIVNQCKCIHDYGLVELIISDNASTDNTEEVVKNLSNSLGWEIFYYRNIENIDDLNFIQSCEKARGEFIWLFADDDLLEDYALERVVKNLNSDTDLYICNYSIWDDSLQRKLKEFRYSYISDLHLRDRDEVLTKFGIGLQFISANIFNRRLFEGLNFERCLLLRHDNNMHLYMLYAGLNNHSKIEFFAKSYLRYRGNLLNPPAPEKWNRIFVLSNFKFLRLLSRENYSAYSRYIAADNIIKTYFISNLIASRLSGYDRFEILRNLPASLFFYPRFIFICLPLLLIPIQLLTGLKVLYSRIKSGKNIYY